MAILQEVTQLVDGVDTVTAKDIMDTQETAINANSNATTAQNTADGALQRSGGTMSGALVLTGGDAVSGVGNMQLDTNGQITAKGTTSTLFGRNNATNLLVGHSSHSLTMRGSATRPTYNGNEIALKNDISSGGVDTSELVNLIYPIGSIYMSVNSVNPSTLFAGTTWEQWGGGRVPVGIGNNGETNYTTAEQTGGSENSVASHNHTQNSHNHSQNAHRHNVYGESNWNSDATGLQYKDYCRSIAGIKDEGSSGYFATWPKSGAYILQTTTATNNATTATNNATGTTGGNRQPFITCYMWKRTA